MERLLDEAGQRAQEVERGAAQAVETAAVAAEGEVAVAAKGVGGAFGYLGGLAEGAAALAPAAGEVAGTLAGAAGVGAAATAGLAVGIAGGAAYGLTRGAGWALENTLFRPQQGSEDAAVQDVRSANNMNDATQPQHFTLRSGSSTSGSAASSRASSQSGFRVQAQSNNTPRTFSWGLNPVALPQSQPSSRASSSVPGSHAGACLRPALTSWRETLRLLKKCTVLHGFALKNAIRGIAFLHGFVQQKKRYSSSAYINVGTRRIVFPSPYESKCVCISKHGGSHRRSPENKQHQLRDGTA